MVLLHCDRTVAKDKVAVGFVEEETFTTIAEGEGEAVSGYR